MSQDNLSRIDSDIDTALANGATDDDIAAILSDEGYSVESYQKAHGTAISPSTTQPTAEDRSFLADFGGQLKRNYNVGAKNIGEAMPFLDTLGQRLGLSSSADIKIPRDQNGYSGGKLAADIASGIVLPSGKSLLANALYGAATGALLSENDQATGALVGAAVPTAIRGIGKAAIGAELEPAQKLLKSYGVPMTPGQLLGGGVGRAEEALGSTVFVGDAVNAARRRGVEGLNKSVATRTLEPIGALPTQVGRAGVQEAKDIIGGHYNTLLPNLTFSVDSQLSNAANGIRANLATGAGGQKAEDIFKRLVSENVVPRISNGPIDGVTYQAVVSDMGGLASTLMKSADTAEREAGRALSMLKGEMSQALERSNPANAKELSAINKAYAQYKILSGASKRASEADDGIFTPAQLRASVKEADRTMGKDAFARGGARMQDLAAAGEKVLGNKLPDSGTATRAAAQWLLGVGGGGVGAISPGLAVGAAAIPSIYSPVGIAAMTKMIAGQRPEIMRSLGRATQDRALQATPVMLQGLIND